MNRDHRVEEGGGARIPYVVIDLVEPGQRPARPQVLLLCQRGFAALLVLLAQQHAQVGFVVAQQAAQCRRAGGAVQRGQRLHGVVNGLGQVVTLQVALGYRRVATAALRQITQALEAGGGVAQQLERALVLAHREITQASQRKCQIAAARPPQDDSRVVQRAGQHVGLARLAGSGHGLFGDLQRTRGCRENALMRFVQALLHSARQGLLTEVVGRQGRPVLQRNHCGVFVHRHRSCRLVWDARAQRRTRGRHA
jgi:hypothetical protein